MTNAEQFEEINVSRGIRVARPSSAKDLLVSRGGVWTWDVARIRRRQVQKHLAHCRPGVGL